MDSFDLFPELVPPAVPSCPGGSLNASSKAAAIPQKKSFAQALNGVCDIPISQLPQPIIKGDRLSITIPEEEYKAGLLDCKNNLHGRILWPKGSTPLTVMAIREKLSKCWTDIKNWGVLSLGKGYFEFMFSNAEDVRRVRAAGSISLNPGSLRLFAWTKDFNPAAQHNTAAQVWVRFFGLSQEYWRPRILFAIASSVGNPICIDASAAKSRVDRTFGHFVRVLVEMDLTQPLSYNVLVEREGFAFFADIEYENLPEFCAHCKKSGHSLNNCKTLNKVQHSSGLVNKPRAGLKSTDAEIPNKETDNVNAPTLETSQESEKSSQQVPVEEPGNVSITHQGLEVTYHGGTALPNYFSQPSDGSEASPSDFVADTGKELVTVNQGVSVEALVDRQFLRNSWDALAEADLVAETQVTPHKNDSGTFTKALSNLKKKHKQSNVNQKYVTRSQAGLKHPTQ
ncbi:uncharacterized protein LOC131629080 [Vicia villosa]|uniref:uncharacterized protein LOC131629080 n=1 Tax=Vicia villosa TaxID=3911 RepID=UPI00273AF5A4|nr:uncharacterized protein LOC131629080 [Vicia villosa]